MADSQTAVPVTIPSPPPEIAVSISDTMLAAPPPDDLRTSLGEPLPPLPELVRLANLIPEPKLPEVPGFVLEKVLGRGGMGVVYQAKQTGLNRTVALKMILGGDHASGDAKQRFLAEAEAIAQVQHSGIVQVYEFGTHEDCPFFALEYVAGGSLDRVLLQGPLPPKEAAQLVAALAEAIQAAHEKGIVHRDLKPANILLAQKPQNAKSKSQTNSKTETKQSQTSQLGASDFPRLDLGVVGDLSVGMCDFTPKITDFGLAKQLHVEGLTATGAVMGTPAYMAPEQAAGQISRIGPATDVYALGTILYECLTGRPPFRGASLLDTLQQVQRQEPVPVRQLQPNVPKDLETICHKCLHKEPAKRYLTAQALADDLRNHLDGKPILARPVGRLERAWKWCQRYPTVAALFLVALLAAAGMTVLAFWAWGEKQRAEAAEAEQRRAKELAQERADKVMRGVEIISMIFRGLDPQTAQMDGAQLRNMLGQQLEKAGKQLAGSSVGDPAQVAKLQTMLGFALIALGQPAQAIPLLEEAAATSERLFGPDDTNTLVSLNNLGSAYYNAGQLQKALPLFERTLAKLKHVRGPNDAVTLSTMNNLALVYRDLGQSRQALPLLEETLRRRKEVCGPDDADTLSSTNNLALAYVDNRQPERALPLLEEALANCHTHMGPDHPFTLLTMANLGNIYRGMGQLAKALPLLEQALPRCQTVLGPAHPNTILCLNNLAMAQRDAGQLTRAVTLLEQALAGCQTTFGPNHPRTLGVMDNLAGGYLATGQTEKGLTLSAQALTGLKVAFGPGHERTLKCMSHLARNYLNLKRLDKGLPLLRDYLKEERRARAGTPLDFANLLVVICLDLLRLKLPADAEPLLREALEVRTRHLPKDHWHIPMVQALLGAALADQRKFAEAEPQLLAGYEGMKAARQRGALPSNLQGNLSDILQRLIAMYEAWDKPDEAAKWKKELEDSRKSPSQK